jgi:hypothetical protein
MNFHDAVRSAFAAADYLAERYLGDLTPEEMLERPAPDANHVAWQLGHLIAAERHLVEAAAPGSMPELPAGFVDQHKKDKASSDNPSDFLSKSEYLKLAKNVRAATLQALDRLTAADLDKPVEGRVPPFVKRVGDCFVLIGNHWALHAGQWVVLRRKLSRERLF